MASRFVEAEKLIKESGNQEAVEFSRQLRTATEDLTILAELTAALPKRAQARLGSEFEIGALKGRLKTADARRITLEAKGVEFGYELAKLDLAARLELLNLNRAGLQGVERLQRFLLLLYGGAAKQELEAEFRHLKESAPEMATAREHQVAVMAGGER